MNAVRSLANGLLDALENLPQTEQTQLLDAAIAYAVSHGIALRRLTAELRRVSGTRMQPMILVTPRGSGDLAAKIEQRMNRTVLEKADVGLIGGAILHMGDDRMDMSLSTMLKTVRTTLSSPLL